MSIAEQILMPELVIDLCKMHRGPPSTSAGPSLNLHPPKKSFGCERGCTMAIGSYENGSKTILMKASAHFARSHFTLLKSKDKCIDI